MVGKKRFFAALVVSTIVSLAQSALADYSEHPDAIKLVDELVSEEGLERQEVVSVLAEANKRQSIIDAISRPAEKTFTWGRYRNIFLKPGRIQDGAKFWRENRAVLSQAEAEFGVPAEIIVAIIGVETLYGGNTGSYRVIDALSTLAFDYPKRSKFFRSELKHFLILTSQQGQDPLQFKGSYAGAMGLGQFMPSSYRAYAKGYKDDGFIDIWTDTSDAIWSVANYLKAHKWKPGQEITRELLAGQTVPAALVSTDLKPHLTVPELRKSGLKLGAVYEPYSEATLMALDIEDRTEHWVGWHNFYVITRYNHSHLYAMAVYQLAEQIRTTYESEL